MFIFFGNFFFLLSTLRSSPSPCNALPPSCVPNFSAKTAIRKTTNKQQISTKTKKKKTATQTNNSVIKSQMFCEKALLFGAYKLDLVLKFKKFVLTYVCVLHN